MIYLYLSGSWEELIIRVCKCLRKYLGTLNMVLHMYVKKYDSFCSISSKAVISNMWMHHEVLKVLCVLSRAFETAPEK